MKRSGAEEGIELRVTKETSTIDLSLLIPHRQNQTNFRSAPAPGVAGEDKEWS